jgi:hypothetical protein
MRGEHAYWVLSEKSHSKHKSSYTELLEIRDRLRRELATLASKEVKVAA